MLLRKFSITAIVALLFVPLASQKAQAATFTTQEINEIHNFQKEYANLDKTNYNVSNIYAVKPSLSKKFKAGSLNSKYINTQVDYINYYRSLFGLTPVTTTKGSNSDAQKTAAVMAAINANPFINQHGLPSEQKPAFISKATWKLAKETSESSNLNFNVSRQSAGDVITDLITDHYNLNGTDTGHRAWLLSTRLTTTGIGAAYGKNGYRYSVQKVLNANDMFRAASQPIVTYPSVRLFPSELAKGKNIVWSIYLSNRVVRTTPTVTIRDLDTDIVTNGTHVRNYSSSGYGNFKTIITYSPGRTHIVPGHEYEVNVNGVYKYRFKLFKQDATNDTTIYATEENKPASPNNQTNTSLNKQTEVQSPILLQNKILNAAVSPQTVALPANSNNLFEQLAQKNRWKQSFFVRTLRIQRY